MDLQAWAVQDAESYDTHDFGRQISHDLERSVSYVPSSLHLAGCSIVGLQAAHLRMPSSSKPENWRLQKQLYNVVTFCKADPTKDSLALLETGP